MKEIEVKARVKDEAGLITKLSELGCVLSEPVEQDDAIYSNLEGNAFLKFAPGKNILRIRKAKGKIILALKQPQGNELANIEKELEIGNAEEMAQILKLLDYPEVVRVVKTRRKTHFENYEICIDEVQGLGSFVEVEKMSEENPAKIQEELFDFLASLGVKREDRVCQGYDTMLYEQKGALAG